jgi:hypothetical protein
MNRRMLYVKDEYEFLLTLGIHVPVKASSEEEAWEIIEALDFKEAVKKSNYQTIYESRLATFNGEEVAGGGFYDEQ